MDVVSSMLLDVGEDAAAPFEEEPTRPGDGRWGARGENGAG